jgi:hypothetical protein
MLHGTKSDLRRQSDRGPFQRLASNLSAPSGPTMAGRKSSDNFNKISDSAGDKGVAAVAAAEQCCCRQQQ